MYIVRWLMGHPIIATWALGAIAILLSMGSAHNSSVEKHEDKTAEHAESAEASAAVSTHESTSVEESTEIEPHAEMMESTEEESISVNDESTAAATEDKDDSPAVESADSDTTEAAKVQMSASTSFIPKKEEKTTDSELSAVTDLNQVSNEELLQMAREAYWNNGLDEAAQIYNQLIKLEPKVIGHKGELGNVLWRQGFPKKAAELYSDIAIPMIEAGNSERVANMVGFIGLFYPDRASVIQERLESTSK